MRIVAVLIGMGAVLSSNLNADEELLASRGLAAPTKNSAEEPRAAEFSCDAAVKFLDAAALHWQQSRGCFTCHTNFAYLYARPGLPGDARNHQTVRGFAEELVQQRWPDKGPRWDAEIVAAAAALAYNDAATTNKLHAATRAALDRMWQVQREDGGWSWLKCNWPPMESDDHYGVTLAAIAVGVAPGGYAQTSQAQVGMQKLRKYLGDNPPPTLHHRAMLVWADSYSTALLTGADRESCLDELKKLQRPDGGWAAASLGNWKRGDDTPQDTSTSDGYGTGFVMYVLRRGGVPANDPALRRGVQWLQTNQRFSGRWFTRSLYKDNQHFLTHAGTAFALMALRECNAIELAIIPR